MSGSSDVPAWSVVLSQAGETGFAFVHEIIDSESKLIDLMPAAQRSNMPVVAGKPGRVPPQTDVKSVLYADLSAMNAVLEHELPDQVIHVQTGISIAELNDYLAKHHQWCPIYAPDTWTLLDAIAAGMGGALVHRFGGPRDLVLGMRVVLANGTTIKCGGRVVKNVTGYDLGKLFIGSHNWLGIIESVYLRLYALPEKERTLLWVFKQPTHLLDAADALNRSGLPLSCLELAGGHAWKTLIARSGDKAESIERLGTVDAAEFVLAAQVHGLPDVVDDVSASAATVVNVATSSNDERPAYRAYELEGERAASFWEAMTNHFGCVNEGLLEAGVAFSVMRRLIADPPFAGAGLGWTFRPATGRLGVAVESGDSSCDGNTLSVIRILQDFAAGSTANQPINVAMADAKHNYHVHRLPSPDPVLDSLQAALKQRFDSSQILNPFVQL